MKSLTPLTSSPFSSTICGLDGESDWGGSVVCDEARGLSNRFGSLLVVLLLILSGCGDSRYYFSKPGFSQQQYDQDNFECLRAAQEPMLLTPTPGMPAGGMVTNKDMYFACFRAKGYTVTSEDQQQRQAEYQQLMAEKRVLDEQKRVFDEQKHVLDEQRAALSGGGGLQQYEQAVGTYKREVVHYTTQVADYSKQVADFNKRLADYAR